MTTITSPNAAAGSTGTATQTSGFGALGSADFIKLMTTQMQQQDPLNPMDSKDMLAQLAQFSSLSGITDVNTTLQDISAKLDAVMTAQRAAAAAAAAASTPPPAA
ncbi:MAG: hypothetical protein FP826_00375 [Sphingomonadales bacterium]|nr:hypothetical protein [Sphingomonadales bacterium]MBU3991076.1 hypothetical protein [Alphaproteobacteria bacterium]